MTTNMTPPVAGQGLTPQPRMSASILPICQRFGRIVLSDTPRYHWFLGTGLFACLAVATLVGFMRPADRLAGLTALLNCIIALTVCYRFLRINPAIGMIPTLFLMPIIVRTSVSTLYFCLFSPDVFVRPYHTTFRLLDGNVRLQMATLLAVLGVSLPWLLFAGRARPPMTYAAFLEHARRMAAPVFLYFFLVISLLVTMRILSIGPSTPLGYVVYGLFRYGNGLPLVAGAAWLGVTKRTKFMVLMILAVNLVFNTFANSRNWAFMPTIYFGFGLLFLSRLSQRAKVRALVVLVLLFGVTLVVGNAGRRLGLGLWHGGVEDLSRRMEVLSQKSDKILHERWGQEIFVRLFYTGGHQIVTLMPDVYPYKPFNPLYYLAEVVSNALLPGRFSLAIVPPIYENRQSLIAIGHRITESHSVERSFVGAAWEMGGYVPVFVVGTLTGSFLLMIGRIVRFLFESHANLGVVVFTVVCDRTFQSGNEGLPSIAHGLIYSIVIGIGLFCVIGSIQYVGKGTFRRRVAL